MTTYTVVTLFQIEAESHEDALAAPDRVPNGETEVFAIAAPLRAVVLTMNQPLVAVEALARMARCGKGEQPKVVSWAGDSRRFTNKRR